MPNRFRGSYRSNPKDYGFKGRARIERAMKREEAIARNAVTPPERRKAYRRARKAE